MNSQHMKTHSPQFECKEFSKRFATSSDLRRHTDVHRIGLEVFRCSVSDCTYATARRYNVLAHVRTRHRNRHAKSFADINPTETAIKTAPERTQDENFSRIPSCSDRPLGWSIMMSAASTGENQRLMYLLQRGIDVNTKAEDGYTALHCAAKAGHVHTVHYLLQNGAHLEANNEQNKNRRPLHEAIQERHVAVTRALLQSGANFSEPDTRSQSVVDYIDRTGDIELAQVLSQKIRGHLSANDTALQLAKFATKSNKSSLLKELLLSHPSIRTYSSKPRKSLLFLATISGHSDVFNVLFSRSRLEDCSSTGFTRTMCHLLLRATARKDLSMVKTLLEHEGIDVNQEDDTIEQNALHAAVADGNMKIATLLLSHIGVNINSVCGRNRWRMTALHTAVSWGKTDILKLLLSNRMVDSRLKDGFGHTPIGSAFLGLDWNAFRMLAEHEGIDLESKFKLNPGNLQTINSDQVLLIAIHLQSRGDIAMTTNSTSEWQTLFIEAARLGWAKIVQFILDQLLITITHKWILIYNRGRATALHTAIVYNQHEVVSLLVNHPNIDVNCQEGWFGTALHVAVRYDNITAVISLLARKDIDLTLRNWNNQTALELARAMNRDEMANLISKRSGSEPISEKYGIKPVIHQSVQHSDTLHDEHNTQDMNIDPDIFSTREIDPTDIGHEEEDMELEDWIDTSLI